MDMKPTLTLFLFIWAFNMLPAQGGNELALARRYEAVSDSLSKIPDNQKAILFRKKALNIYQNQRPVAFEKLAASYRSIGIFYRKEGKFNDAEFNLKRSVEVAQKHLSPTHPELAKAFNSYGIYLLTIGNYESALDFLNKSLSINQLMSYPGIADNLNNIGIIYENLGTYEQAMVHYRKAMQYNRAHLGLFHLATANNYINMGTACLRLDEYDKARAYFDTTLLVYNKILPKDHPEFAALYNNLGAVANIKGDYRMAIENFEKALSITEKNLGKNHPDVANIYANTGLLLMNQGDINKALAFFNKAYDIRFQFFGQKNHLVARTCNYLGDCFILKKDYDQAYDWYNKAILIFESLKTGDPVDYAEYKNDLGFYYEKLGNAQAALKFYNEALGVVRRQPGKQDPDIANSLARIGNVYLTKSNFTEATKYFKQALSITQRYFGNFHPDVALLFSKLSLANADEPSKAMEFADSAMQAVGFTKKNHFSFEQVSSPITLLDVLKNTGKLQQDLYASTQDRKWLNKADSLYETGLQLIDFVKITLEEPSSRQTLLDNYFLIYENAIAVKCELKNLTGDEKYWHQAFAVSERSNATLLLEALQSVHAGRFAELPDSLLKMERQFKIELAYLEKQLFEEQLTGSDSNRQKIQKLNNQIFEIQQRYTHLLADFRREYPRYFSLKYSPELVTVPEIQSKLLMSGQNMVGYFVGEENVFAFVISEKKFTVVPIVKEFPLEAWVEEFRNSIYQFNPASKEVAFLSQKYSNLGFELYQLLFEQIRPLLSGNQLVILPGGVLGYLPFDALLATASEEENRYDKNDYLLNHFQISYSYSATLHKEMMGRNSGWKHGGFVGFAPSYGGDSLNMRSNDPWRAVLGNLKYNKTEVRSIQRIMGGKTYLDSTATEQKFLEEGPNAGILHLAVHAKSNDEHGEYSYLAFYQTTDSLENELVFVKDLYSLRIKAALVVLSACETGIGELQRGEGIVSLARGFSYAGAASIVTTLWSIDDYASAEIMEMFYENLKKGDTKDAALRKAKLAYLSHNKNTNAAHPLYWAAFIPVGDMSAIKDGGIPIWAWPALAALVIFLVFGWKKRRQSLLHQLSYPHFLA